MELKKIDIVGLESFEASLNFPLDCFWLKILSRASFAIGYCSTLCKDVDFFSSVPYRSSDNLLSFPPAVEGRSVYPVYSEVESGLEPMGAVPIPTLVMLRSLLPRRLVSSI